ncbi:MAG: hypothetical protein LBU32_20575 [Clostridiales bacterium]|jgi:hypothetical protein|nr:hypothetical protein [Clostridiales bacterium]
MDDKLDKTLKGCFSDRKQPPPSVNAALRVKLLSAARKREMIWTCAIMLYAVLYSTVLTVAAWMFTSNRVIAFTSALIFFLSVVSAGTITIACRKERAKGGVVNVNVRN